MVNWAFVTRLQGHCRMLDRDLRKAIAEEVEQALAFALTHDGRKSAALLADVVRATEEFAMIIKARGEPSA